MINDSKIRKAMPEDGTVLINLLTQVFKNDPVIAWYLHQDEKYQKAAKAFFGYMVNDYGLPHSLTWMSADASGASIWIPPGKWKPGIMEELLTIPIVIKAFGSRGLLKKLQFREKVDALHPKEPHFYLAALGVAEEQRGQGLGKALLLPGLEMADSSGVSCYLETSQKRNLPFYERAGFCVTAELAFCEGRESVWTMFRPVSKK